MKNRIVALLLSCVFSFSFLVLWAPPAQAQTPLCLSSVTVTSNRITFDFNPAGIVGPVTPGYGFSVNEQVFAQYGGMPTPTRERINHNLPSGSYNFIVFSTEDVEPPRIYCSIPITVPVGTDSTTTYSICDQIPASVSGVESSDRTKCEDCLGADAQYKGIWTAIGCIKGDPASLVQQILTLGLGMAGGIALLMFLTSAFLFTTAQNDPKRVSQAKEIMGSAIIGLLFIVFSVTILQFIGVTILQIPDFGI